MQFNLFGGSVLKLGTERHHGDFLRQIDDVSSIGCFALTELGCVYSSCGLHQGLRHRMASAAVVPAQSAARPHSGSPRSRRMPCVHTSDASALSPNSTASLATPCRISCTATAQPLGSETQAARCLLLRSERQAASATAQPTCPATYSCRIMVVTTCCCATPHAAIPLRLLPAACPTALIRQRRHSSAESRLGPPPCSCPTLSPA